MYTNRARTYGGRKESKMVTHLDGEGMCRRGERHRHVQRLHHSLLRRFTSPCRVVEQLDHIARRAGGIATRLCEHVSVCLCVCGSYGGMVHVLRTTGDTRVSCDTLSKLLPCCTDAPLHGPWLRPNMAFNQRHCCCKQLRDVVAAGAGSTRNAEECMLACESSVHPAHHRGAGLG